jgi:3-deoxy-D-manno-octulosonic-acid transferase
VVLVDTIGELSAVWGLADIAFVGGSLFPGRNGQNMMEPAAYGASVLFGSFIANFQEAVDGLLARNAAVKLSTPADLKDRLMRDLDDPELAAQRGAAARDFVLAQQGAASRTVTDLDSMLETSVKRRSALIFH